MKTEFYVQFSPRANRYSKKIEEVVPITVSQGKPRAPKGGAILVKFSVDFDDRIFQPFEPSVVITVPLGAPAVIMGEVEEVPEDD